MAEMTLQCDAADTPLEIWEFISQSATVMFDVLRERYSDFDVSEEDLIYTKDEEISVEQLVNDAKKPLGDVTLLQKTVYATRGDSHGVVLVFTWETRFKTRVHINLGRYVTREHELDKKTTGIYVVCVLIATMGAGAYYGGPHGSSGPVISPQYRLGVIFLLLIGLLPGIALGFIAKTVYFMKKLPRRLLNESDAMVKDLRATFLSRHPNYDAANSDSEKETRIPFPRNKKRSSG